jgi:drug/metabolite transporter (DMT)-like permease
MWFLFASLTALFESLKDAASKRGLQALNEYVVAWSLTVFTLPLLLPVLLVTGVPKLGPMFPWALLAGGSTNVVAILLYIRALKLTDLSIAVPLIAFTPLFLLVTSPLIVGEHPTASDAAGIAAIVVGSYVLNLKQRKRGILAPLRALLQQRGAQLMLLVAFIWSFSSTIDKVGVRNSSPSFWAGANFSFIATSMLPLVLVKSPQGIRPVLQYLPVLAPVGLLQGAAVLCQMQAISLTLVAHVISVKRTSTLLSVLWGHLLFRERGLLERASGAAIMVGGVALIALG